MERIDSRLMRVLSEQGRQRKWLAAQLGIGPWTLSRIESGVQSPPADFYERSARILGVAVDDISPESEPVAA